jgi:sugar phosphate isomerase/epimerase
MKLSTVSTLRGGFYFPDLLPGDAFRDRLVALKRLGFDVVEIWGKWLKEDIEAVEAAVKAEGVPVGNICSGFRGNLLAGDKDERLTCIEDMLELLELAARLESAGLVFVPLFGKRPQMPDLSPKWNPYQVEHELFINILGQLSERATQLGVKLLLEPVNRYETHLINSLDDAVSIIKTVGSDAIRITADFFHMNIEEADIAASVRRHARFIGHVHLADSNRFLPGQGHTDFGPALQELQEAGYRGSLSMECFAKGDPLTAVSESVAFMKKLLGGLQ